jgi:hypothetical protein
MHKYTTKIWTMTQKIKISYLTLTCFGAQGNNGNRRERQD